MPPPPVLQGPLTEPLDLPSFSGICKGRMSSRKGRKTAPSYVGLMSLNLIEGGGGMTNSDLTSDEVR